MNSFQVVELIFGNQSAGSGYLITNRHVLTARHVVQPCKRGAACKITPLNREMQTGKAAWVPDSDALDFAIIETDEEGWSGPEDEFPGFGIVPSEPLPLCRATGFPLATRPKEFPVTITVSLVYSGGTLLNLAIDSPPPAQADWWRGFSGAAVFSGKSIVGVVKDVVLNFNSLLMATPIGDLLNDQNFRSYWAMQQQSIPQLRKASAIPASFAGEIASNLFWLDREVQTDEVLARFREVYSKDRCSPQIIAVPGYDKDEHSLLMTRLGRNPKIQKFLKNNGRPEDVIPELPWPNKYCPIDPDEEFVKISDRIDSFLDRPVRAKTAPPGANPLRLALDNAAAPRAFWLYIRQEVALGGYGVLLCRVIEWWLGIGPGAPIVLFLCLALDEPKPLPTKLPLMSFFARKSATPAPEDLVAEMERWAKLDEATRRPAICGLSELSMINMSHLDRWIRELPGPRTSTRSEHLDALRLGLVGRLAEEKRLREVHTDIHELLRPR